MCLDTFERVGFLLPVFTVTVSKCHTSQQGGVPVDDGDAGDRCLTLGGQLSRICAELTG